MITNVPSECGQTVAGLLGSVVTDFKLLCKQQLALFKVEIQEDFRKSKAAAVFLALGVGLAIAGAALLTAMLVGFLTWAVPALLWWEWCGVLGGTLIFSACTFFWAARIKVQSFSPVPEKSVAALKENVQWILNQK